MRFCSDCTDKITCIRCNSQLIETKVFEANLKGLKIQSPNQIGRILPYCKY